MLGLVGQVLISQWAGEGLQITGEVGHASILPDALRTVLLLRTDI